MVKRLFDISVSGLALAVLALPLLLVAGLIRVSSPGPVFFLHRRLGREGRPFRLAKFRTMYAIEGGPSVTVEGDRRITPVGGFLRRWKIDELPQFWNVLCGDMSIIGPRPEAERFAAILANYPAVLHQKPGLGSMAQLVYPHEAELLKGQSDPEAVYAEQLLPKKLAVDAEYESRRTFASDLGLIVGLARLILGDRSHVDTEFRFEPRSGATVASAADLSPASRRMPPIGG